MATIVEAIKAVLVDYPDGLTSDEIYEKIIEKGLYEFKAVNPPNIVRGMIRRYCFGLDFPTAYSHKYFKILTNRRGGSKYALFNSEQENYDNSHATEMAHLSSEERLPEEKISECYNEYIARLKTQLMDAILNSHPSFFEELVLELLMKMGYGYDDNSGAVTRYCKDGGIDGIIEEDKLGFGKIYIQAKRNSLENAIGAPDVQQFHGAMGERGATKGAFITTSHFAKGLKEKYSNPTNDGKMIKLIDGDELIDLLIRHEIGVKKVKIYNMFTIDENYFDLH